MPGDAMPALHTALEGLPVVSTAEFFSSAVIQAGKADTALIASVEPDQAPDTSRGV